MPVIPALEVGADLQFQILVQGQSGLQGALKKTMYKLEGEGGDTDSVLQGLPRHTPGLTSAKEEEESLGDSGLRLPILASCPITEGQDSSRTLRMQAEGNSKWLASPQNNALGAEGFDLQYV